MENKPVIFVTSIGKADDFRFTEDRKVVDPLVAIISDDRLNKNPSITTYDGREFIKGCCYIEHPFKKGVYLLLDDTNKVEGIIQRDRDAQITKVVGMLGATFYRCKLHTIKYSFSTWRAVLKSKIGLFKGNTNAEFKEESEEDSKYDLSIGFTEGGKPNVKRAREYLFENHLEKDQELIDLIDCRDQITMGGKGHIINKKTFIFDYTQNLNQSLEAAMSLSKVKVFKVDGKIEAQTKTRISKKIILELYFDGAERIEKEEDEKKLSQGIITQEAFAEKWN